ncbi:tyrosine-type recombinase/integrase [Photobacterium sagamiensis]|uniref:tyrosine-type recombinase/integrase n=1 Tax=Photobacterium sagamiensis TaxID=2910241 RepID=UPI003D0D51B5
MTKDRSTAIQRNFLVASTIKAAFLAESPISYEEFKKKLDAEIDRIRRKSFKVVDYKVPSIKRTTHIVSHQNFVVQSHDDIDANLDIDIYPPEKPILDVLNEFIVNKRASGITHLTCHQLKQRITHFAEFVDNKSVESINSQDIMKYLALLNSEGRSKKTNKDFFASVKQFLKWARLMFYIDSNPAQEIVPKFKKGKHASEERERWELPELLKLFDSHYFTNVDEDLKWVTLLLFYHGLRPSEACQLRAADFKVKDGIYYLKITDEGENQHVKNEHAVRIVPIHRELLRLNFIEFVSTKKKLKTVQLFNYRPLGKDGDWSKQYRTKFGKIQTSIGFEAGDRPTAYSFRHTFIDELKQAGIAEHDVAEVVGHVNKNITFGRYGKKSDLKHLQKVVDTFDILGGFA